MTLLHAAALVAAWPARVLLAAWLLDAGHLDDNPTEQQSP